MKPIVTRLLAFLAGGALFGIGCGLGQRLTTTQGNDNPVYAQSVPVAATPVAALKASDIPSGRTAEERDTIQVIQAASPAVVKVINENAGGLGTGVIIDGKKGIILTNAHVVRGAGRTVSVKLKNAKTLPGTLLGVDSNADIAVIKVDSTNLPQAPLGNSDRIEIGQTAITIGNPLGLEQTATKGIISGLNRRISQDDVEGFIQTDAAINPGNSGGPLLDSQGKVIGINTAVVRANSAEGLGFAVPINLARDVANQVLSTGRVQRVIMGVELANVTPQVAQAYNLPVEEGVLIYSLQPGGPAIRAGVRPGDIVTKVDGKPVDGRGSFLREMRPKRPGDTATLTILRSQKGQMNIKVRLEAPNAQ